MNLNEALNDAIVLWAEISGMTEDLSKKKSINLREWDKLKEFEELNEARTEDMSGLTAMMILDRNLKDHVAGMSFGVKDVLNPSPHLRERIAKIERLEKLIESVLPQAREAFVKHLQQVVSGLDLSPVQMNKVELFMMDEGLTEVRKQAVKSMEDLEAHQFYEGESDDPEKTSFKVNPLIYEFSDINELLGAVSVQKTSGATLCLIRNRSKGKGKVSDLSDDLHSYFAFAFRNGENVFLIVDREKHAHPLAGNMRRRPDRLFDSRADRNMFPYQLVVDQEDVEDETGRIVDFVFTKKDSKGLIIPGDVAAPIYRVADLEPYQILWTILMCDLIRQKYWREGHKHKELSYTGLMVQQAILPESKTKGLMRIRPNGLELKKIDIDDMEISEFEKQLRTKSTRFNEWAIEHYKSKINQNKLEMFEIDGKKLMSDGTRVKILKEKDDFISLSMSRYRKKDPDEQLVGLKSIEFGTKQQLDDDRKFLARVNYTRQVKEMMDLEHESTKEEINKWMLEQTERNRERLIDIAASCELVLPSVTFHDHDHSFHHGYVRETKHQAVSVEFERGGMDNLEYYKTYPRTIVCASEPIVEHRAYYVRETPGCACCGKKATVEAKIEPTIASAIKKLFDVDDLPWQLQYWVSSRLGQPYDGNCILDRVDPGDWIIVSEWEADQFAVYVALCKSCFDARRKKLGLKKISIAELKDDKKFNAHPIDGFKGVIIYSGRYKSKRW